jgi:uncharacterized protein YecT (DUF1311 family)
MNTKLAATIAAAGLCLGATAPAVAGAATISTSSGPPVIKESYTPLPCKGSPKNRTTVQMEGCAEQQVTRTDTRIDGLAKQIYVKLDSKARTEFVAASRSWLRYRDEYCVAAAAPSAGGTIAPLITIQCETKEDSEHVTDLQTFLQDAFTA